MGKNKDMRRKFSLLVILSILTLFLGIGQLQANTTEMIYLDWSPDGEMLSVTRSGFSVDILEVATGQILNTLPVTLYDVAEWSPDGTQIAIAAFDQILLWQHPYDAEIAEIETYTYEDHWANDAVWHPTEPKLAIVSGEFAVVFNLETEESIFEVHHEGFVYQVAWSHDGNLLASVGSNGQLRIWDGATGEYLHLVTVHHWIAPNEPHATGSLSWSPDDSHIVTGTEDGAIEIWDLTNAEPVVREPELSLQHYGENVYSVDWNAENNLILSGDVAGTISIWNATTGEILQTLDIDCPVYSVAWSPDGTRFAYANADGEIEIVNIDIEAMPTPTADS